MRGVNWSTLYRVFCPNTGPLYGPNVERNVMNLDYERNAESPANDLIIVAIVHVVILAGFFAVHFGVAPLW